MNRVTRWLRRVYPPWWAVGLVLAFYALFELVAWGWFWWGRSLGLQPEPLTEVLIVRDQFMLMAAGAYAVFRIAFFHPLFRSGYRRWLEQTPWTTEKPLPLGPIHMVVQDLLMLGMMRLLLHDFQLDETALPQTFLFAYLIVAVAALWGTGERNLAYFVVFGCGLAILAHWWEPLASVACLIGCYLLAAIGIQRSLRQFPWSTSLHALGRVWREMQANNPPTKQQTKSWNELEVHPKTLGWPYSLLNAEPAQPNTSRADRVVIGLLAGWLLFALAVCPDADDADRLHGTTFLLGYVTFGCIFGRLFSYCVNHWPPISLWGRLWTGRWIIPGYDKVFIAPLLTAVVGWGGLILASSLTGGEQPWFALACGGLFALTLIIATVMGPSHQRWKLTAPCRTGQMTIGSSGKLFERI
ncbi:MAG: hypothetical protein QGH33_06430 [Pirellulaceae bacterium]|nr:hypothetical protein [Pirellulaceae bacterium]HJN09805.1 hypothetical protein [Pirellulaceae bacterium]